MIYSEKLLNNQFVFEIYDGIFDQIDCNHSAWILEGELQSELYFLIGANIPNKLFDARYMLAFISDRNH